MFKLLRQGVVSMTNLPSAYSKYRWTEVSRKDPSKRPAAERVTDYGEIMQLFSAEAAREQASRCLSCPNPTCMEGCPLNNRIPDWLALASEGDFLEAAAVSQCTSNLPELCSRVCPQERLCEGSCILGARSQPVAIGAVEKFINEFAFAHGAVEARRAVPNGLTAAVVGSGPGGLACADELAKFGYDVTVFEAQSRPGGLLVNGIPSFKLDKSIVERRLDVLRRRGVVFKTGIRIGRDIPFGDLQRSFHSIFLGVGAQKARVAGIPGEELPGVQAALGFLIQKNVSGRFKGELIDVRGRRVVVLGGGDTAMDCLRTALRAGAAESICLYRRDLANMPGSRKEYHNAIEEGARFEFLTNPVAIESGEDGRVAAVRCVRMQLGEPDAQGRRKPVKVPGSEFRVEADVVLVAYGFDPEPPPRFEGIGGLEVDRWGAIAIDSSQMTSLPGVFAGGDSTRGASLVAHAVRDGRAAAFGMHVYLQGRAGSQSPIRTG